MPKTILSENLKLILNERDLTQKAAAELAGVKPNVFNGWLAGAEVKNMQAILKFSKALNIDFQWLLTGSHSNAKLSNASLSEIFEVEDKAALSGVFLIEAKRLKRRDKK